MGHPDRQVAENDLRNFDVHLQEFYKKVIGKEIGFKFEKYAEDIDGVLAEIILFYKKEYKEKSAVKLRFVTRKRRCAYILKHSPLFTSTVAFHFSETLNRNRNILKKPFNRARLNLCCLGGGPASELVAISKVLGPLYSSTRNREPLELKVTIVDINEYWETTCQYVIECLKEDDTFKGMDNISISFNLIKADLSKPFREDVRDVIEKADVITMVYFVSAVNGGQDSKESLQMAKKIMEMVKDSCVLFFMDNATDVHFLQMYQAAREMGDMETIYGPCVEDFRKLSLNSVKKFLEIYKGFFDLRNCMTHGFMSYCVWRKTALIIDDVEDEKMLQNLWKQKNNEALTKEFKSYKRTLIGVVNEVKKSEPNGIGYERNSIEAIELRKCEEMGTRSTEVCEKKPIANGGRKEGMNSATEVKNSSEIRDKDPEVVIKESSTENSNENKEKPSNKDEVEGKIKPLNENEAFIRKPNVPLAPLRKPRGLRKSGSGPSSNSHLSENNEEVSEETTSGGKNDNGTCKSTNCDKTQKSINAPKVNLIPLQKPRKLK